MLAKGIGFLTFPVTKCSKLTVVVVGGSVNVLRIIALHCTLEIDELY